MAIKKIFYHITHPDNLPSIVSKGLVANEDGEIFLFDAWKCNDIYGREIFVCDDIARNQIGLDNMLVLEVNPKGFKGELIPDNVAELTAKFQWILKQPLVSKSFIKIVGTRKPDLNSLRFFGLPKEIEAQMKEIIKNNQ